MKLRGYQEDLINETRRVFINYKRPLVVLPCGAGKTVCFAEMAHMHIEKKSKNNVWFLVHRKELIDQTLETFEEFGIQLNNVYVGMVQTVSRNLDKYKRPTMIIFDEAHHAKAKTWTRIIDKFSDVPMVGLTATPNRLDGKPLGYIFDKIVQGVSNDWLIKNEYLSTYDYYAPPVLDMQFKTRGADYDLDAFTAELLKSKIYGNIKKYINPQRKTIIYCPSIKFSQALSQKIGATHFDGSTPKKERERIVQDFKEGKIRILSNVDLIGEGFDVPDCDTVILLRPTMSLSLYIQQSTRCLRPMENKKAIIYDLVGNVYRHGLPTDAREWSLTQEIKIGSKHAEPGVVARQCKNCLLVFAGNKPVCPYCGHDNGKTKQQIEHDEEVELERIKKVEKRNKRREVGMAKSLNELIAIGRKRNYKNPEYWARTIIRSRKKRYNSI